MLEYIKRNYDCLRREIDEAVAKRGGGEVELVAVTKSGSDEELISLLEAGAPDIGENRPQELVRRGDLLRAQGYAPRLHEIGNLQKNKVRHIIESVYMIHSVDSLELAREIDKRAKAIGRRIPILIEVNSGREEAKGGVMPEDAEELFLRVRELDSLIVSGIMTMGPVTDDAENLRPYFRSTRELFDKINTNYGFEGKPTLSMGMSDSFEAAIAEGSTIVRIGRSLFEK